MNKRLVLLSLPLLLLVGILARIAVLPSGQAGGFPNGPGTVCLIDSSTAGGILAPPGPCSGAPYTFDAPPPTAPQISPTQIRVGVYINGSVGLNGFDINL